MYDTYSINSKKLTQSLRSLNQFVDKNNNNGNLFSISKNGMAVENPIGDLDGVNQITERSKNEDKNEENQIFKFSHVKISATRNTIDNKYTPFSSFKSLAFNNKTEINNESVNLINNNISISQSSSCKKGMFSYPRASILFLT